MENSPLDAPGGPHPNNRDLDQEIQNKKTRAETKKLKAETSKLKLESQHLPSTKWLQNLPAIIAILGAILTFIQVYGNYQAGQFHQDELFSKAVIQLGSREPNQRAAAVTALSDYVSRSSKYTDRALTLIVLELQSETDVGALQISIQTLPQFGVQALTVLVSSNRLAYDRLIRATGRYLGIQCLRRINQCQSQTDLSGKMITSLNLLPDFVRRTSLAKQDTFIADIADLEFFQTPDEMMIHRGFKSAFEEGMASPPPMTSEDEKSAQDEFDASIRSLWVSTQAITAVLRSIPVGAGGIDLYKTVLLHPQLANVDLRGIDAQQAIWMAPVLRNAKLRFADLSRSEMKYADLHQADLTGANIDRADFGRDNRNTKRIEDLTFTRLDFFQSGVALYGTNRWAMDNCYLRDQQFNPMKQSEYLKQRQEIYETQEAKQYLSKIPKIHFDD